MNKEWAVDVTVTKGLIVAYKVKADEQLANALAAAFILVAMADSQLDMREVSRFYETLKGKGPLNELISAEFEQAFNNIHEQLVENFELGYQKASDAIRAYKGDSEKSELIIKLEKAAAVADEKLKDIENKAIAKICEMLGLDPKKY